MDKVYKTSEYQRRASKAYYDRNKNDKDFIERQREIKNAYAKKMREIKKNGEKDEANKNNVINLLCV